VLIIIFQAMSAPVTTALPARTELIGQRTCKPVAGADVPDAASPRCPSRVIPHDRSA
jgi:hypothetical protein